MAHDLRSMLVFEEGRKTHAYADPLTGGAPWTCGIGCTDVDIGPETVWSDDEIEARYESKVSAAEAFCRVRLPWFGGLSYPRQCVLIGMVYQMGGTRVMKFVHALASIRDGRWADAKAAMLDSEWARQTSDRAHRMAEQMESGAWQ